MLAKPIAQSIRIPTRKRTRKRKKKSFAGVDNESIHGESWRSTILLSTVPPRSLLPLFFVLGGQFFGPVSGRCARSPTL